MRPGDGVRGILLVMDGSQARAPLMQRREHAQTHQGILKGAMLDTRR
jgi:hypothetical protein